MFLEDFSKFSASGTKNARLCGQIDRLDRRKLAILKFFIAAIGGQIKLSDYC